MHYENGTPNGTHTPRHLGIEAVLWRARTRSLGTRIAEFALRREQARQHRIARSQLAALDDRLLRDIGVTRAHIRSARHIFERKAPNTDKSRARGQ